MTYRDAKHLKSMNLITLEIISNISKLQLFDLKKRLSKDDDYIEDIFQETGKAWKNH